MMKKYLLDRLAAYLLGSKGWGQIQAVVDIVNDPALKGAEKRERALSMLGQLSLDLAGYLLNLGIELAVAKLRI